MDILILFIARFLLSELFGVSAIVVILLTFIILVFNIYFYRTEFLKISREYTYYFIAISLLMIISLFNQDISSIANILILYTLPFIPIKSNKYLKFITPFVLISAVTYSILIISNHSIYDNRNYNYLIIGKGLLLCQTLVLFNKEYNSKFLKLFISLILLVALAIMHGRLNAVLSIILILIYLLKNFKYSWVHVNIV